MIIDFITLFVLLSGLKIRVSVVRFRPWAPSIILTFHLEGVRWSICPTFPNHVRKRDTFVLGLIRRKCLHRVLRADYLARRVGVSSYLFRCPVPVTAIYCVHFCQAQPAVRRAPFAGREHCNGRSASSHHLRKRLPNPFEVNGRLKAVTRNVRSPQGDASMTRCNSAMTGRRAEPVSCCGSCAG